MSTSKLPAAALAGLLVLVGSFEGVRYVAYKDPVGVPTICFGHTAGVLMGDVANREQCDRLLMKEILVADAHVQRCITSDISDGARTALASLVYNAGPSAVCGSTLQRHMNAQRFSEGCAQIKRWVYAKGIKLPGLVRRREAEYKLCMGE